MVRLKSSEMEEIENVPLNHNPNPNPNPVDSNSKAPSVSDSSCRPPLHAIPENPKVERTPVKIRSTPDRPGFSKNRFGFSTMPEFSGRTTMSTTTTTTTAIAYGDTPSKSVNKPPNPNPNPLYSSSRRPRPQPCVVNTLEVSHFDLKEDPSFWMDHNVQVIIRVRPLNANETCLYGYNRCVKQDSAHSITWIGQPETRFTFDHVACETVDQEMLFRMAGLPMVENCLSGYNSCMFAYGQTGSGKTHTMLGEMEDVEYTPSPHRGMTPRIFEFLFARIRAEEESRRDEKLKYSCKCSFLEIYNEQITDLLDPSSTNLLLREDVKKGVYVENLSEFEVHTVGDVLGLLIQGSSNRKVAATNMNRESSRSHCVFICIIESKWERDSVTNYRFARLNLVDLAGSERQKSSGAEGERLKEAANINKSLSTLGHVIMLLVDIAHGKPRHIPYRDSRLTFLLQDSLGGNSKTMIIANVSPSICCAAETLNTLKFAQRAKLIQNNAVVNEDSSGDVAVLQHQILLLKEELSALKHQNVSRALAFDPSTSIRSHENNEKDSRSGNDQLNSEDLLESEWQGGPRVLPKQIKSLEMMLTGALRREQMAETSMKQLEAKIEQLNRLVRQREEDTRCTKMMLKFREDKIHRMESLLGGVKPVDAYLLEENAALSEEIQMLQAKVDRNPEVTRFAVENIRLLEELRRFQDFYEEGERDLLMNEVSELRAQLIRVHDNSMQQHVVSNTTQDATNDRKEHDFFASKLTDTANELAECQTKLKSCLETNSKLSREIEELHVQLRNKDTEINRCHNILDSIKEVQVPPVASEASSRAVDENRTKRGDLATAEELVNLELELDILKIILKEEKQSRGKLEELASSLARDAQMAEQQVYCISKQHEDAEANLAEAKSVIHALESQQQLSFTEIEDLKNRNSHHMELLCKQERQISALKEQASKQEFTSCLKQSDCENSPLQEQLKRMQASLDKAKRLNMWYKSDHAYQRSNEEEMDEIRRQAEAETAEVIVCLQEELSVLQERVYESDLREKEAENKVLVLETELKKLHEDFDRLSYDNKVLCQSVQQKETQIKLMADDWELLSYEIEDALMEGHEALRSASNELDSASTSSRRGCISEQVGKMIRQISDKESLIAELNNCLEEANTKASDMEHMLMSLKGATIVLTEAHQQECCQKEKEILKLKSELHASISAKEELYMSEKSGVESSQALEVGVLGLQEAFTDFEKLCEKKLLALYHKLDKLEEHTKEAKCSCRQTKELLEYELEDSKAVAAQKAVEASSLLVRFEEVQETMEEADMMINGLMIANETMKHEIEDLKNINILRNCEIDRLVNEVRTLQSANDLKDQECINLEKQLVLDASESAAVIEELQRLVSATQEASEDAVMSINHDYGCVKSHLEDTLSLIHSSLEDIWSELVSKDCMHSVLYLCHIGMLSEAAEVKKSEDDLHEICESKLINDLREQNMKSKQEIEMHRLIMEGILTDFNSSLNQISSKEGATRELDLKLDSFKENLAVLQHQEEVLLETFNSLGSKLTVLEEELNQSNLSVAASLEEQETLQKSNAKLNEQAEVLSIELYAKDLALVVMASELQQLSQHNSDMVKHQQLCCTALDSMACEISSKEGATRELDLKLDSFNENLAVLQSQEEVLLETCNLLGSKLTVLEEELNQSNLSVAASLAEQEKMQKSNAKLNECQAEMLSIELYAKDLDLVFMASELQQLSQHNSDMVKHQQLCCTALDSTVSEISSKEGATRELDLKVDSFNENLAVLQRQEEVLLETCNLLGSKLTVLEEELNQSNLSVAASLAEQEKMQKSNAKLNECQAEVLSIELYAKDLSLVFMASELQQLSQHNSDMVKHQQLCCTAFDSIVCEISSKEAATRELDLKLNGFNENLASLQHEEEVLLETSNLLGSKLTVLEEELNQSNLSVTASLVEQEKLQKSNAKSNECQIEVLSMELCAKDLDLIYMASELQQLSQHNSDMVNQQQLCCTALESMVCEIFSQKIFADLGEQLLLEKEMEVECLQTTIQKAQDCESRVFVQLQALNTLSSKVAKCAYGVETIEVRSCRMLNQLEQNIMSISDQMFEDSCQNMKLVSTFLEELERVDCLAKEIVSQNQSLEEMLLRKDDVLNGLLFDLRLLQESAVNSKDQQDHIEKIEGILESTEYDLATKSRELHEAITFGKALEAEVKEQRDVISSTKMDLENANQTLKILSEENEVLKSHVNDIMAARSSAERQLCEKTNVIDSLEYELLEMGNTLAQMNDLVESLKSNLNDVNCEKDHLRQELFILEGKLETAQALAGESEAIAVESQQIAESRRIYAEEKEEEVQLLERSVQELDSTISVLENKVDVLKEDAERQRLQREELELELHAFKNQMQSVEFADSEIKRQVDDKTRNLQEALTLIKVLEKDLAQKDTEVAQCRAHISELSIHAEAQASEYKQKFKELESMLEQFRAEAASNHERNASCNKLEKNPSKARGSASPFKGKASSSPFKGRGSGSPFKCIGLGLVHQLKSEKDEENNADRLRIEELEALAANRQKEIFMLNARLAATESMTHDVIRDLLGVKLDMNNCANLLDKQRTPKIVDMVQLDSLESQDPELANLKKQLNEYFSERKGWLEELDRRQTELVAAEIALEKLREQEMFLSTENSVLKRELTNHKRQVIELEEEVEKLSGQQKLQQRIHHHAKIKEENNMLKIKNEELGSKVRQAEAYLKRVRKELANFRGNNGTGDRRTSHTSYLSAIDR